MVKVHTRSHLGAQTSCQGPGPDLGPRASRPSHPWFRLDGPPGLQGSRPPPGPSQGTTFPEEPCAYGVARPASLHARSAFPTSLAFSATRRAVKGLSAGFLTLSRSASHSESFSGRESAQVSTFGERGLIRPSLIVGLCHRPEATTPGTPE